jgi:hypothetical protein
VKSARRITLLVYALGVVLVLQGLGWMTWHALALERREGQARAASALQEAVRIALWRMESRLIPIVNREAAHPHHHFDPLYATGSDGPGETVMTSPLLREPGGFVRLHFQIGPGERLVSRRCWSTWPRPRVGWSRCGRCWGAGPRGGTPRPRWNPGVQWTRSSIMPDPA